MKNYNKILIKQSRFILMGEMMANISHQWKQPLNTINLAVLSAKTATNPSKKELEKYFNIIEKNVNHLSATIDEFTSFLSEEKCTNVKSISDIVEEIKTIVDIQMLKNGIKLNIVIDNKSKNIMLASSISQVLINLLSNAKDAFDTQTENKDIELKFISTRDSFKIECCDNGKGISTEIKDNIFDPYFTTKEKSEGTGIGLYMSKQIIKKVFNGKIQVQTRDSQTCFLITIPFSDRCLKQEIAK